MKTNVIIFSKHRTLQLKSLLLSLRHFGDVDEQQIYVLYVDSPEISYQPLMDEFKCHFVQETAFLKNVQDIVDQADSEYSLFMVDDLIMRDRFSINEIETLMDQQQDIDAFCLRLGENIECLPTPHFRHVDEQFLFWDTAEDQGKYWNYFWDLSSSLYRKERILTYISRCRADKETFPNPFEYHYYSCMPSTRASKLAKLFHMVRYPFTKASDRVACYKNSKAITQGVNLVAEIQTERAEQYTPEELHRKMLDGYIADYEYLQSVDIKRPQPGHTFFKLIQQNNG